MSQTAYRANLSSATYPMTIADGGRTVIIPGPDNNYDRRVDPTGQQLDAGIPQALYLENVMPTSNGYQSVGYMVPGTGMLVPAGASYITKMLEVPSRFDPVGPGFYNYSISTSPLIVWNNGTFSHGRFGSGPVVFVGTAIAAPGAGTYSTAVVKGVCYLYYASTSQRLLYTVTNGFGGLLNLTEVTPTVTPLNFFSDKDIFTICASSNYLVGQSTTTVYWSSTTTPTDFVSSLVSGAGQIDPNNSEDALQYLKETTAGFYVYAQNNIIFGQYTGNARYPFKFGVVLNSTGPLTSLPCTAYGGVDTGGHYVIEKNKIIKFMQERKTEPIATEVSDFLDKTPVQELFNEDTNTFIAQIAATEIPSIYVHANRYILVSVNGTSAVGTADEKYTHVIVFDSHLRRYGRLKINHSFIFEVQESSLLGFINKQNNTIRFLTFDLYQTDTYGGTLTYEPMQGVLLLGKFQHVRSRFIKMEDLEVEGPQNTAVITPPLFSCYLIPSMDGRNLNAAVPLTASYLSGGVAKYPCHTTAQNHCVLLKGAFNVNTLQLKFTSAGDR